MKGVSWLDLGLRSIIVIILIILMNIFVMVIIILYLGLGIIIIMRNAIDDYDNFYDDDDICGGCDDDG